MQRRQHTIFTTVRSEGAILPADLLSRVATFDPNLPGLTSDSYYLLKTEKLNEAINRSWNRLLSAWSTFKAAREKLPEKDMGTTLTRERWLLPLFSELGYGRLLTAKAIEVNGKSYAISHGWQHTPIHLVSFRVDLDQYSRSAAGAAGSARNSPHSLVQELLNRSEEHLWAIVSNGLRLRVLRNNASLTRQAYVEFDLEAMMNGEVYADFALLWLLCHQSRVEAERPAECWLEKWSRTALEQGTRALDQLRNGVEKAITALGGGFLAHPANSALREKLRSGALGQQDYYRQVLRLVYRLIVLFVAEDREILFHPAAGEIERERYSAYYSTARLRRLAEQRVGTRHADLFAGLRLVMEALGRDNGYRELGLPALDSFLFSREAVADLTDCEIANRDLLDAIRSLALTDDRYSRRVVDYKNLGAEELGSVYESLLELHPVLHIEAAKFELKTASGHERKTTGSYYTPTSLINCLLDSALDPVLDEAEKQPDAETAILNLKVCDPACGSGHFLIAAAHRIAKRLASIRTGVEEPAPAERRRALRDVVGRCIYGVDINPMSVELCKVSLWMEAIEPGKPLSFLEQHIQCGNSLLGATPALLANGIPDSAFEAIEGDEKKICSEYKKKNKYQREGNRTLFDPEGQPWERLGNLAGSMMQLDEMRDDTVEDIRRKQKHYEQLVKSSGYEFGQLWADAWCAAFVWKKTGDFAYPITEEVFRNIERNPHNIASWMKAEIIRLREQYQFFHWHLAFPDVFRVPTKDEESENEQAGWSGGFDVVLGNPPWERIKIQEKEWFAQHRPDIANAANAAQRRRMIAALQYEDPAIYNAFMEDQRQATGENHIVHDSGRFPLCGRGDVNTYSIFAETMRLVISPTGRVGCIAPSGIATDDTTKFFFRDMVDSHTLVSLYSFENEEFIFPEVHHATKFCLLTISGKERLQKSADFVFFARQTSYLQDEERHFSLSAADIALLNPNTRTCPIFRSKRDMELTKAIYERVPVLLKDGPPEVNPWGIKFFSMFHMANDSHLFRSREQLEAECWHLRGNIFYRDNEVYLPPYEAKMIWHFNHRFGTYEGATKEDLARGKLPELNSSQLIDPDYYPLPSYWVPLIEVKKAYSHVHQWLLGFRAITGASVLRTFIATIIPMMAAGHSLSFIITSIELSASNNLCFLANLSTLVEDYVMRQNIGGNNLSFFIVKQIPFLLPSTYVEPCLWSHSDRLIDWIFPRTLELTYTAWDLEPFAKDCGYDGPPFRWDEERRFLLRCELDAAYFHLYGIERDDVDYIMETFPIVRRKDEKEFGEFRTKRVILEVYDEMRRAMESGEKYGTRLVPPAADPAVAHGGRERMDVIVGGE
jgi:N-6 DNA Methylase